MPPTQIAPIGDIPRPSSLSAIETARSVRARIGTLKTSRRAQFNALMRKNSMLQWRQYRTNLAQIIFPLAMILLLLLFQVLIDTFLAGNPDFEIPADTNPKVYPIIPTLGYGVRNSTQCDAIPSQNMSKVMSFPPRDIFLISNLPTTSDGLGTYSPFYPPFAKGYLGNMSLAFEASFGGTTMSLPGYIAYFLGNTRAFSRTRCLKKMQLAPVSFNTSVADRKTMDTLIFDWWISHSKTVLGAVEIEDLKYQSHHLFPTLNYTVVTNLSLSQQHEDGFYMSFMDAAFVRSISKHTMKFTGLKNVPRKVSAIVFDLAGLMGPFLLIYVFQLMLPVTLSSLVYDREQKLLEIMKMMGLSTSVYWIVTYFFNYLLYTIAIGLMYALAYALNLSILSLNDASVLVICFLLWGHVQIAFAFFLSVFFSRSKTSMVVGYFFVFGSGLVASQIVHDYFSNDVTPRATMLGLQAFPPFVLYRMLLILGNNVSFGATGLRFADISEPDVQMDEVWIIMAIQYVVFMLLAAYLDQVFPKSYGVRKHPLFMFQKSFWVGDKDDVISDEVSYPALKIADKFEHEPADVAADRTALKAGPRHDLLVKILDISKHFSSPGGKGPKKAVDRLSLGIADHTCFGFLGPNGAGKTTLINMICGLIQPTAGTTLIGPLDIRTQIDTIHAGMGVCPQDNILWEDLTGRQHLLFYGRIKALSGDELDSAVMKALDDVNLLDAGDKKAGEYSGGMKRRLSVACALIGNPMLVLLDEPTTGLDPASRRKLWDVVREYKKNALVVLTTHSMEEADALCDRLCIMDQGHILCVGTGPELKSRFGRGFKLTIMVKGGKEVEQRAVEALCARFKNLTVINSLGGVVNLELALADLNLGVIFDVMENIRGDETLGITDWGVEHSTLEEVFLRIVGVLDGEDNTGDWV